MFHLAIIKVLNIFIKSELFLTFVQDTVAIQPSYFSLPADKAIKQELDKKYANRVLPDVGLGICVFDLSSVGEGKVRYGDGCYWYEGG